jgi:ParE toxin of type II toxin-antitoxin system, parDE
MKLRILPSAMEDLHRGREFYARQGHTLGDYFLDSLFADIDSLELYAGIHAKFFGCHRLLAKRFPFAIYYKMDGELCVVWRVLDCRQNPSTAMRALTSTAEEARPTPSSSR